MTRGPAAFALVCAVLLASSAAWTHPGVLVSPQQLAFVREQVANETQPFYAAYQKLLASQYGKTTPYVVLGPPGSGIIECGSYSVPDYGCTHEDTDASTAYLQALLWAITGTQAYADNAIAILNAYAGALVGYNNSNAPLQSAWSGAKWSKAAEIVAHTGAGWPAASLAAFVRMLYATTVPLIYAGSDANGNWEASMIEVNSGRRMGSCVRVGICGSSEAPPAMRSHALRMWGLHRAATRSPLAPHRTPPLSSCTPPLIPTSQGDDGHRGAERERDALCARGRVLGAARAVVPIQFCGRRRRAAGVPARPRGRHDVVQPERVQREHERRLPGDVPRHGPHGVGRRQPDECRGDGVGAGDGPLRHAGARLRVGP